MNTSHILGGQPPVNGAHDDTLPLQNIRGMVRKAIATQAGGLPSGVNMDAPLTSKVLGPVLQDIGSIMDRNISVTALPQNRWTGSLLSQHLFEKQSTFPKTSSAQ